ncbi:hypothetical protein DPMN_154846 [Dreissena polymorpha]|uniref:Uncharacterized protein n=1 Tax=Dreissena polymorpha TaxID=45954 RepID=A0A9D4J9H5_DREPO|nr:hypothetical protein DPMN_154846 [Dreissena polymorpha]
MEPKGNRRDSIFSPTEEAELANYVSEKAQKGMGLRPCEILDQKRITPFSQDRPLYSSTKSHFTVMFCASASGAIMPPFYVYPDPPPKGVHPLSCSLPGGLEEL